VIELRKSGKEKSLVTNKWGAGVLLNLYVYEENLLVWKRKK